MKVSDQLREAAKLIEEYGQHASPYYREKSGIEGKIKEVLQWANNAEVDSKILMPADLANVEGAKALMTGWTKEMVFVKCERCPGKNCSRCYGVGHTSRHVNISWKNIQLIYKRAIDVFGFDSGVDIARVKNTAIDKLTAQLERNISDLSLANKGTHKP